MNKPENVIYIDIETTTKYKDITDLKINDSSLYNLLVQKYEKSTTELSIEDFYVQKASISPTYGKIVCLTVGYYNKDNVPSVRSSIGDEKNILLESYPAFKRANNLQYSICGYAVKKFDLPWINMKLLKYNLIIPQLFSLVDKKPWEMNVFDIYDELSSNYWTLSEVCYELGISTPISFGNEVYDFYWNGNIDKVVEHCESDVMATMNIYKKIYELKSK